MKIADPERLSVEVISNVLTGCHMEEVLEENAGNFMIEKAAEEKAEAGKPVYAYGRDESDLARTLVLAVECRYNGADPGALRQLPRKQRGPKVALSFSSNPRSVTTTKGYFVFEKIGPLLFFCYSPKEGTSILLIHEEFHLLYQQLVMLLSTSALSLLQKKPNYDIRELLGSTRFRLFHSP